MYSLSLCSCAGPQHGRCSAPAPWQVGKTPLQVRVQCKVLLQSSKCWLVTAALSVCQGNRHTQQSSTITWAEIKSQNDFLRTFLALAGRRNDIYFSAVAVHNPWCDAERAAVKDVLLSGTTFNTLHGASGGLAELVSLKPCSWACCSNIWLWWPERPLLPSQRLYLRIFFCLIAIPFKSFSEQQKKMILLLLHEPELCCSGTRPTAELLQFSSVQGKLQIKWCVWSNATAVFLSGVPSWNFDWILQEANTSLSHIHTNTCTHALSVSSPLLLLIG